MGAPKTDPRDSQAPVAPPPPEPIAEELKTPELKKRRDSRRRGASGLIVRRPSINVGAGGTGVNI